MDTTTAAQWPPQEIVVKPMEEMVKGERKQKECPRCNSSNTKFCYYNNYSLSQPRYFCKTCRRYWTEGGSLRNIPVGGASRKNKNNNKNKRSNSISNTKLPDLVQNPKIRDSPPQDLNLAFALHHHHHDFKSITDMIHHIPSSSSMAAVGSSHDHLSSLELLTSTGLSSFMPPLPTAGGFALPELKPSLNFSLDGYGSFQRVQETNGKQLLFPFQDLKMHLSNNINQQNPDQNNNNNNNNSTGSYWNGLIGGGGGGSW